MVDDVVSSALAHLQDVPRSHCRGAACLALGRRLGTLVVRTGRTAQPYPRLEASIDVGQRDCPNLLRGPGTV